MLGFVPIPPKELMYFCVIYEAIIILVVIAVVPTGITFAFLSNSITSVIILQSAVPAFAMASDNAANDSA